jgi:hypothetical protein
MKKTNKPKPNDEMRAEYDFSKGVRGKHASRYWEGTNIVALAPDVAKVFKNSDAVNAALRGLIEIAGKTASRRGRSGAA